VFRIGLQHLSVFLEAPRSIRFVEKSKPASISLYASFNVLAILEVYSSVSKLTT